MSIEDTSALCLILLITSQIAQMRSISFDSIRRAVFSILVAVVVVETLQRGYRDLSFSGRDKHKIRKQTGENIHRMQH